MYAIRNNDTDKYVARSGCKHSYTKKVEDIQFFPSFDSADKAKCGNETVVQLGGR